MTVPASRPEPADLLKTSPFPEDLDTVLTAGPPRVRLAGTTLALSTAVVAVAGFLAGVQADKTWGDHPPTTPRTENRFPAAQNQPPGQGFAAAGDLSTGTITKIDGSTLTLRTRDGRTLTVRSTPETRITITKDAELPDLPTGTTIVVSGRPAPDGSLTATTITQGTRDTPGSRPRRP
ncbi:hypothetical protein GCM10027589_57360 [Actinocorallia lasiicapitis]